MGGGVGTVCWPGAEGGRARNKLVHDALNDWIAWSEPLATLGIGMESREYVSGQGHEAIRVLLRGSAHVRSLLRSAP